jgi:uncharacterized spore protein YtfJ
MSATRLIEGALDKVRATAGVKTVYGEPITVNGKTIIPIAKVADVYAAPAGVVEISGDETKYVRMVLGLILGRGRRPQT